MSEVTIGGVLMSKHGLLDWLAYILVIVGAINWGLVGLFGFNLVDSLTGDLDMLAKGIYILVGVAGVYLAFVCGKKCKG